MAYTYILTRNFGCISLLVAIARKDLNVLDSFNLNPDYACFTILSEVLSEFLFSYAFDRAVPNIRFVFASGPNSGMNSYSVFGRIVAIGPNTNSDICFFVCGGHNEWRCCRR